jgi:hypothetical protein
MDSENLSDDLKPQNINAGSPILGYATPSTSPINIQSTPLVLEAMLFIGVCILIFDLIFGGMEIWCLNRWPMEDGTIFPFGDALCSFLGMLLAFIACKVRTRRRLEIVLSPARTIIITFIYVLVLFILFAWGYHNEELMAETSTAWALLFPSAIPWLIFKRKRVAS